MGGAGKELLLPYSPQGRAEAAPGINTLVLVSFIEQTFF